jgi:hypothetical protein
MEDEMDELDTLPGAVLVISGIVDGYLDRIRDHRDQPAAVDDWARLAKGQLRALREIARSVVAAMEEEANASRT